MYSFQSVVPILMGHTLFFIFLGLMEPESSYRPESKERFWGWVLKLNQQCLIRLLPRERWLQVPQATQGYSSQLGTEGLFLLAKKIHLSPHCA